MTDRTITTRLLAKAVALLFLFAMPAYGQTLSLSNMPAWESNTRFFSDGYDVSHPSLSLNGFDCDGITGNCNHGLGLKQVLEQTYNVQTGEVLDVFIAIILQSQFPMLSPTTYGNIVSNTDRLQARAFVALASYVLDKNGYDPTSLNPALPAAAQALTNFRSALMNANSWMINGDKETDGVKWATATTNVARAIDLYLALENAYKHYDVAEYNNQNATTILSINEKDTLLTNYTWLIDAAEQYGGEYHGYLGVDGYDFQAGNWPLKVQVAIGYAILTWQDSNNDDCVFNYTTCDFDGWLQRAFKAAGKPAGTDRYMYWNYQTDDGKHFWAEGPYYFHLTLSQVIPFWHAARINKMLNDSALMGYTLGGDPFTSSWFTRPLEWLADLATPDGKTPPIDDGNKISMYNTTLLRWTSAYGNDAVGQKFAWISNVAGRASLLPVEIAIPRRAAPTNSPLPQQYGNTSAGQTGESGKQQVVFRRTIGGDEHYLLLNGESGDAIRRGEGHEQGDQLQLLYYVDDFSYLVDSGYDKPKFDIPSWTSSTWNHYYDHNVMTLEPHPAQGLQGATDGGVLAPKLSKSSFRVVSEHQNVDALYRSTVGNIDIMIGQVPLHAAGLSGSYSPYADYYRTVLFVRDPVRPYLVDINAASSYRYGPYLNVYGMLYRGNASNVTQLQDNGTRAFQWNNMYLSHSTMNNQVDINKDLFIQPFAVEWPLRANLASDIVREPFYNVGRGLGNPVQLLRLDGLNDASQAIPDFTTVALIQALPDGGATPSLAKAIREPIYGSALNWQAIAWQHSSTVVDVAVVRSAIGFAAPSSRATIDVPIPEADYTYVRLPQDKNYGFARLVKQGGNWVIDSNYQVNIVPGTPPPLGASITGPSCVVKADPNPYTWKSAVTGGQPPYSYQWYKSCESLQLSTGGVSATGGGASGAGDIGDPGEQLASCTSGWASFGTNASMTYTVPSTESPFFTVKLIVTDQNNDSITRTQQVTAQSSCTSASVAEAPAAQVGTVQDEAPALPQAFALGGNYPNPFNPQTTIRFALPEASHVRLAVYDLLGRLVAKLLDGTVEAGHRQVAFDGSMLPSGTYLYRLDATGTSGAHFTDTGHMVLMK